MMATHSKTHLMVKVSKQYFEAGLTQQQIARSLRISRSSVSRLLTKAREEGIVQIAIEVPSGIHPELEKTLEQEYNLVEVIVVDTLNYDSPNAIANELARGSQLSGKNHSRQRHHWICLGYHHESNGGFNAPQKTARR
jgi:DNA-binding transcriptional regulator LsrR (DeoR family)